MKKKYLFIVNPISGTSKKDRIVERVAAEMRKRVRDFQIVKTEHAGHARELAKEAANVKNETVVTVIGGDGTVNEVATGLLRSNKSLGIIPLGSGNGLARHLNIPLEPNQAFKHLLRGQHRVIDSGLMNAKSPFFCTLGMGFDAEVTRHFNQSKTRGLLTYAKIALGAYWRYRSSFYQVQIDGKQYEGDFFCVTVANASQFGNDAHIAPNAHISDGLFDVVMVKKFPKWKGLGMTWRLFNLTIHKSKYVETVQGQHVFIKSDQSRPVHIDGEYVAEQEKVAAGIVPRSLKVVV